MKKYWIVILLLVSLPAIAAAQSNDKGRAYGYLFAGPGVSTNGSDTLVNFGTGAEGFVYKGLAVGAEIGGFTAAKEFKLLGALSPNVSYHFLKASKSGKVIPFITGGYTLFFGDGVANRGNFGGGVNYWFKDTAGLRFEVRDYVIASDSHIVGFRFGLILR